MIRPNLAYAKGRKLIPDDFFQLVSACLEKVNPKGSTEDEIKKNYDRFVELMQALVAYIKYYGGQ
jgi:CRISPR-associated protein Csm2